MEWVLFGKHDAHSTEGHLSRSASSPISASMLQPRFIFAFTLSQLGVSHMYCSPCLPAAAGPSHGYDMSLITSTSTKNWEALQHTNACAPRSNKPAWASCSIWYPITWRLLDAKIHGGGTYWRTGHRAVTRLFSMSIGSRRRRRSTIGAVADFGRPLWPGHRRTIQAGREGGSFHVRHGDSFLPRARRSLDNFLAPAARNRAVRRIGVYCRFATHLPTTNRTHNRCIIRRHRDKEILRELLKPLCASGFGAAVDADWLLTIRWLLLTPTTTCCTGSGQTKLSARRSGARRNVNIGYQPLFRY